MVEGGGGDIMRTCMTHARHTFMVAKCPVLLRWGWFLAQIKANNIPVLQDNIPVLQDNIPVLQDNIPVLQDNKVVLQDNKSVLQDSKVVMQDNKSVL